MELTALALVAGGFALVYFLTKNGSGGAAGVVNQYGQPFLTDAQVEYYTSGFANHMTAGQAALTGASAAGPVAAIPIYGQIAVGIGALAGYLSVRNSNDTREDREVFAKRLGFTGANNDGLGIHTQLTTSIADKSKGIYSYLTFIGRDDLRDTAMRVIGRKDFTGNVQWFADVLVALWAAGFQFPR